MERFDNDSTINEPQYLTLDSIKYNHPITGTRSPIKSWFQRNKGEELQFLIIAYTYQDEADYDKLQSIFERPVSINKQKIKDAKHNWLSPNFNTDLLPEGVKGGYWLGYIEGIKPKPDGKDTEIEPMNILAHPESHANAGRFWPILLDSDHYVYIKIAVLEETGYSTLSTINNAIGKKPDGKLVIDVAKDAASGKWDAVARAVVGVAINGALGDIAKIQGLDLEYAYESKKKLRLQDLHKTHQRIWEGHKNGWPRVSFELKFNLNSTWTPPVYPKIDQQMIDPK